MKKVLFLSILSISYIYGMDNPELLSKNALRMAMNFDQTLHLELSNDNIKSLKTTYIGCDSNPNTCVVVQSQTDDDKWYPVREINRQWWIIIDGNINKLPIEGLNSVVGSARVCFQRQLNELDTLPEHIMAAPETLSPIPHQDNRPYLFLHRLKKAIGNQPVFKWPSYVNSIGKPKVSHKGIYAHKSQPKGQTRNTFLHTKAIVYFTILATGLYITYKAYFNEKFLAKLKEAQKKVVQKMNSFYQ